MHPAIRLREVVPVVECEQGLWEILGVDVQVCTRLALVRRNWTAVGCQGG